MRFALCLAFFLVAASATSVDEQDWEFYKQMFNKKYSSGREHHFRKSVFLKNRDEILSHNARFDAGLTTHKRGVNEFSDMEKEEFESFASCLKVPKNSDSDVRRKTVFGENLTLLPEHLDWREKGAVTEVKNQGQCGSCWAFSAIGSLEGRHFMETGELVSLSVQNLIDCDRTQETLGCDGGWSYGAFQYIIEEGGVDTEESYPYIENEYTFHPDRKCRFNSSTIGASIKSVHYTDTTTQSLMLALVHKGPIAVAIYAGPEMQHYSGGILESGGCSFAYQANHGVVVVGYGVEKGVDYWIVKNSWGPKWGEEGYFRIMRGLGHDCMLTSNAVFAD